MTEKLNPGGLPATRKKYPPAFKAECGRQVAAGARQTGVARAQGSAPALLGRWQRSALEQTVPGSAERDEINRLRAELRRHSALGDRSPHQFEHGLKPTLP
ncbi:transposase [Hymenobacter terricola]|uniref:transposase n=1 Tax=Hymenobacter terricola TaxID=2819236 RepID=UPI001B3150C9|nr:transposase [Hymenobacter terricola]